MKKNQTQSGAAKRSQYHTQIQLWRQFVDQQVSVWYRRVVNRYGDLDDLLITGELLEVKEQGLCIEQPQHPDGEVFIPFSQVRAYEKHEEQLYADFEDYLSSPYYQDK